MRELYSQAEAEAAAKEEQRRAAAVALQTMAQREHERKVAAMREWDDEELRLFDKAVVKFPQGISKRCVQGLGMCANRLPPLSLKGRLFCARAGDRECVREAQDMSVTMICAALAHCPSLCPPPLSPLFECSWEQAAAYIRTRTLDEVLLMVKERQGASAARMRQQEDWKGAAKKRAEVTSEADLR